jgi:hypothetical protein
MVYYKGLLLPVDDCEYQVVYHSEIVCPCRERAAAKPQQRQAWGWEGTN